MTNHMKNNITVKKERAHIVVDTLKKLYPHIKPSLTYKTPFELLVAVILSAQCTDARVNIVTKSLFRKYKSVKEYADAQTERFEKDIFSTGFYRQKAKNIIATAKIIHEKYHDTIPQTMEQMLTLPGVARKTANVVLGYAFGIVEGIAVDTHVIRLSRLYGLTGETSPEKIEQDLMKIIPKSEWIHFTMRVVQYGRDYCPAKKHDHKNCPITLALSEKKLLPQ